jgi:glycosyltransferase involved in cell wall biosynthesis
MNILHVGNNICGIPNTFKRAENLAGHNAKVISFVPDPQGHISDYDFNEPSRFRRLLILLSLASSYETFIFTSDSLIWGFDILLWKLLGKKVAIQYHGSEVRGTGNRFFHKFSDALFVSTPDLCDDVTGAIWLPNPIFVEDYKQHYSIGAIISHAPTNREIKGTENIIQAYNNAKKKFPIITLDLVEGVSQKEALEQYRKSTIVIDQLKIGWYGMVALECMAMKVPVMCYIRNDLEAVIACTGFTPIWYTSMEHISNDLITVLSMQYSIIDVHGEEGYEYVKKVHDPKTIVDKMLKELGGIK